MNATTKSLNEMKNPQPRESSMPSVAPGFESLQSFELMQRAATLLSNSTLVPVSYRAVIEKTDKFGNIKESKKNANALSNCVVALNMSQRMGADPLMVMQNLHIIEGRPSWSSQWIIAAINGCGRFSPLRFDIKSLGKKSVNYESFYWENNVRKTKVQKVEIENKICIAWVVEKETSERLESPSVTIEMAVKEGWYTKNGSKWQTMDEVMLRYRAASLFGKLYAPELLMGLQTVEEMNDSVIDVQQNEEGVYGVDMDSLKKNSSDIDKESSTEDQETGDIVEVNISSDKSEKEAGGTSNQDQSGKSESNDPEEQPTSKEDKAKGTGDGSSQEKSKDKAKRPKIDME